MQTLLVIWAWVLAHPAYVLAAWPIVTGLVNLAFGAAEKYTESHPRLHALLSLFEVAGLDARGVLAWLKARLLPTATLLLVLALTGCANPPPPKVVVADVLEAEQVVCIVARSTLPLPQVLTACGIADSLADLAKRILDAVLAGQKHAVEAYVASRAK